MMQAEILFELPSDGEVAAEMIEKARKMGWARLSVLLEAEAEEGKRNPTQAELAYQLGQNVVALSQEIVAIGGAGSLITTRLEKP